MKFLVFWTVGWCAGQVALVAAVMTDSVILGVAGGVGWGLLLIAAVVHVRALGREIKELRASR